MLKRQLRANGLLDGWRLVMDMEGPKLSAVLLEFIEPYKKDAPTTEGYDKLVTMAVIAWNAALEDGAERTKYIQAMVNAIVDMAGEEWRKDAENVIEMMVERKERYFPDDKRYIVDYRLTETNQEYRLAVAGFVKELKRTQPQNALDRGDSAA